MNGHGRGVSAPDSIVTLAVPAWQAEALSSYRQSPLPVPLPASTPICHDKPTAARRRAIDTARTLFHDCQVPLTPADTDTLATITKPPLAVRRERDSHPIDDIPIYDRDRQRPLHHDATPPTYGTTEREWDEYHAHDALNPGGLFVPGHDRTDLLALAVSRAPIPVEATMVTAVDGSLVTITGHVTGCDPATDAIALRPHPYAESVKVPLAAVATLAVAYTDRYGRLSG